MIRSIIHYAESSYVSQAPKAARYDSQVSEPHWGHGSLQSSSPGPGHEGPATVAEGREGTRSEAEVPGTSWDVVNDTINGCCSHYGSL